MKKKDVLIFFTFVVAPLGIFAAGVYYGPKIKKWYAGKKADGKSVESGSVESAITDVQVKKIDEANKTISLSLNGNPEITFSYKGGGAPLAQLINVPGVESNEIALRYIDGKFSVTDGDKVLFEKQIEIK